MKKILLIGILTLSGFRCIAQDDHLEPRGTYGMQGGVLSDYFTNNMFQLLQSTTDDTLVRFMLLPEFEPEKSFYLEKEDSVTYSIHVRQMTVNNLLGLKEYQKIVTIGMYYVEKEFAEKLILLFQIALEQTKYPTSQEIDRDGTLFLFTAKDTSGKVRYAEKWSKINGPNMTEFVSICEDVIECSKVYKPQLSLLEKRIDNLTSILKESSITDSFESNQKYRQNYDIVRYMNDTKDTIVSMKISKIINIENDSVIKTETLLKDYYVKMSPYSDRFWINIRTGNQNIEFVQDKDRGKNMYYARKRYRILGLR